MSSRTAATICAGGAGLVGTAPVSSSCWNESPSKVVMPSFGPHLGNGDRISALRPQITRSPTTNGGLDCTMGSQPTNGAGRLWLHSVVPSVGRCVLMVQPSTTTCTPADDTTGSLAGPAAVPVAHACVSSPTVAVVSRDSKPLCAVRSAFCPGTGQHPASAMTATAVASTRVVVRMVPPSGQRLLATGAGIIRGPATDGKKDSERGRRTSPRPEAPKPRMASCDLRRSVRVARG